jgi:hypothetical protein
MPAEKLSAKEAALRLGTNARTLRKFLRSKQSPIEPVGQGNRYEFTAGDIKKLKKAFTSWAKGSADRTVDRGVRQQAIVDRTTEEVDLDDDGNPAGDSDVDEDEIAFLEGPSEDDLRALEDDFEIEEIDLDAD